ADPDLAIALQTQTGLEARFLPRPTPKLDSSPDWDFEPHEITVQKQAEARKRRAAWITAFSLLTILALVAAGFLHLRFLERGNAALAAKVESNLPAADEIEFAIDRWEALSPAIDPDRSPVELFYRISKLLPEKGFRLTSFEVENFEAIEVRGEGATMPNALKMRGDIENEESLGAYEWEIPQPRRQGDLMELIARGGYLYSSNESE
ncbi:MAG: hypothetical protein AAGC68_14850, partial [Verrucomicrobiota bacterium]